MLKKKEFSDSEIVIYDEALLYLRDGMWQFRMYLPTEKKYIVRSLKTRNRALAIDKGKKLFLEINADVLSGKKMFSKTTKEAVERYLKYRQVDVDNGTIVVGRLTTVTAHLNHFLDFIKRDTRLSELEPDSVEEYAAFRLGENASVSTIANEQGTINAMCSWLYQEGDMRFQSFRLRRLKQNDTKADDVRRQTFTEEEMERVIDAAERYVDEVKEGHEEYLHRWITFYWISVNANAGMRNGEARQLRWSDIEYLKKPRDYREELLVTINIRAETSKVRSARRFMFQGSFFHGMKELLKPKHDDALVFSVDGETQFAEKYLLKHFYAILDLAGIDYESRNIVPYSLRHYMITNRLRRPRVTYRQVAKMVGNSASEIEKTYHHLFDDERIEIALA